MTKYWEMMTGVGASKKKKRKYLETMSGGGPEIKKPVEVMPIPRQPVEGEVLGPIVGPEEMAVAMEDAFNQKRLMRRTMEAARDNETIIEMREVVARANGRVRARTMEVSLSFGEKLSIGELLRGCLEVVSFARRRSASARLPDRAIEGMRAELRQLRPGR
jgi:hypothetical protein